MSQNKVKILVACHKPDKVYQDDIYTPIHVGRAISRYKEEMVDMIGDDTGDNISDKNQSYCELTGLYWAWKNLKDVDIIGLCHYRRYFDFHHQVSAFRDKKRFLTSEFKNLNLNIPDTIIDKVTSGSVVVAKPKHYGYSLVSDYCREHISDDFRILERVIYETQPDYIKDAFFKVWYQRNTLMPYNMCIMKWKDYEKYCTWIFDVLSKVENQTDISHYTVVQRRIFGYMSERLFNVWLEAEHKKLIKKPTMFINDAHSSFPERSCIKAILWNLRSDFGNWLIQPKYDRKK